MLKGKTVVLGVTGSIAAYKIANLASMLSKLHADIHVLMTQNATNFINPITFETLTGNKCLIDTFDRNFQFNVEHVSLAKKAEKLGADYIGAGAVFSTNTKKDTKPLELNTLKEICNSVSIPVVAIGGIDHSNVRELKGTDIDGVAVISALFGASDPGEATRELVSIMKDIIK